MPTDEQRRALQRRVAAIEVWCEPIDEATLRSQLQGTLGMLKGPLLSEQEVEFELTVYATVLRDLPAFAVIAACRDFLKGTRGEGGWKPKPPELRLVAQEHLGSMKREQRQIETVLAAVAEPVMTSTDNRKSVADVVRALLPEMRQAGAQAEAARSGVVLKATPKHRDPDEVLADVLATRDVAVPQLSAETRRRFGIDAYGEQREGTA